MDWHFDNYGSLNPGNHETNASRLRKINGVLTLSGEATYTHKDPDIGKIIAVPAPAGSMVMTGSGDVDSLEQVEHKLTPPVASEEGLITPRLVLLLILDTGD